MKEHRTSEKINVLVSTLIEDYVMDQNDPDPTSPQKLDSVSPELLRQLRELVST